MPELSTLLRQRLRATEDRSLQHPDPDTLTAYVEELLPAHERDRVLQHVSRCSPCREIVSLCMPEVAIPAEPQMEVAVAVTARRRWFLSPAFGLAGSVAAMVLGVALILRLSPPKAASNRPTSLAIQEAKAAPPALDRLNASTAPAPAQENTQPAPVPTGSAAKNEAAPTMMAGLASSQGYAAQRERKPASPASNSPVVVADLRQDFVNKTFLANAYDTQAASAVYRDLPQAPVPAETNLAFAPPAVVAGNTLQGNGTFVIPSNTAGSNRGVLMFYSNGGQSSRGTTLLGKIVDFGKRPLAKRLGPPIPSNSLGSSAMFKPGMSGSDAVAAANGGAGSSSGGLAGSSAFTSRALAPHAQLGISQYQWKVVQGKLLRSSDLSHWTEENPANENLEFTVVSPNGSEIWAGGSQAALVHSRDGGATWERITLGAAATGTINSIEAAGQNVLVKSSSGQSWASQDGGKSWLLN